MFLIFNHSLTDSQKIDAMQNFNVEEFVNMPQDLKEIWNQIPAEISKDKLEDLLVPFIKWIKKYGSSGDIALIQGDFVSSYLLVNFCKEFGVLPVSSTNRRVAQEKIEGNKVHLLHTFEHVIYRQY